MLTKLRSFFGLVNQIAHFSKEVSKALEPLRPLLSKKNVFQWTELHAGAFTEAKKLLCSPPVIMPFDIELPTRLSTDAFRLNGLGFILEQKSKSGQWKLVTAGSRFIIPTESRYAMIELEALGASWAMQKCKLLLLGIDFELVVDHKPLVPILDRMGMNDVDNPRRIGSGIHRQVAARAASKTFSNLW